MRALGSKRALLNGSKRPLFFDEQGPLSRQFPPLPPSLLDCPECPECPALLPPPSPPPTLVAFRPGCGEAASPPPYPLSP